MKTRPWDAADHLKTEEDMVNYLEAAFEDGDSSLIQAAIGDIARARGMTDIAKNTGLGRESLYKSLNPRGKPSFATVLKVIKVLGLSLRLQRQT
jgi:probable addiction module antidote protein